MRQTLKLGLMVLAVAALAATGVAVAQSGDEAGALPAADTERPIRSRIIELLAPLVDEAVINQGQAEAVADTLAEALPGPHGPAARGFQALQQAAAFLDLTPREIAEAMRDGRTLAEIAAENGSSGAALVEHLVGLAGDHLDEVVADGRITEEQKAERLEQISEHLTALVNGDVERPFLPGQGGPGRGRMGGPGGPGGPCGDLDGGDAGA